MGRAEVREAIGTYLAGAGVTMLGAVFQHPPKFTTEGDFVQGETPGTASGGVIYIHLQEQAERRLGLGGQLNTADPGLKIRQYLVELICVFRSKKANSEQVGYDNDAFLDGIVDAILENRTAGNPDVVFQWGEGDDLGTLDIRVVSEMPRTIRQQASQVWSTIEVMALELVRS
jgi:hypothetical protein